MEARDFSEWLADSALEEPSGSEASVGPLLVHLQLGASISDLDPGAAAGIEFLAQRIRTIFVTPALATPSSKDLLELWTDTSGPVLRLMDAVAVLLFEASQADASELILRRLQHSDRTVSTSAARVFDEHGQQSEGEQIRLSLSLVENARASLRESLEQHRDEDPNLQGTVKAFHHGILVWSIGMFLCLEIAERLDTLVPISLRPDLMNDAAAFASGGARLAGWLTAVVAGLGVVEFAPEPEVRTALEQTSFVAFLLRVTTEVPRVFGPDARYSLALFRYPDEPDAFEFHLVIDTDVPPSTACEQLDELCDSWFDEAAAQIDIDIFPVLGGLE